jgi:biopolymer transport protein ExbD
MKIRLKKQNALLSAFSYSSLTDIVMLLLIFFLLTSSFIATKGLKVNLPRAENARTADKQQVTVDLFRDGGIFINGERVEEAKVREKLRALVPNPQEQTVIL